MYYIKEHLNTQGKHIPKKKKTCMYVSGSARVCTDTYACENIHIFIGRERTYFLIFIQSSFHPSRKQPQDTVVRLTVSVLVMGFVDHAGFIKYMSIKPFMTFLVFCLPQTSPSTFIQQLQQPWHFPFAFAFASAIDIHLHHMGHTHGK